ncbi:IclR family transcriptional regulator domain-containing protein [Pseudodonghicola flavimaris]|uniref:IclR family transcriptional regulator C-terminal domain-containing protein n=1 Tax=Pseudodonghicola flavimaris TaxID=3050036 RepID=A0ABT7F2H9_9RHOB|nr:IclR family transcriptional regulator C-terminal domain-containing protein [Pseudodonghicola flavimaris]MDK3018812.1 IclR family transcriptional regulator C-terminal domain-containing protein [Pseudodonghicola flavimaris]
MLNKPTDHIASLAKGLRVIECFGAETPRLTITEAASASGLDRATARRVLLTLHREGYADYDGKFFTLTPRILRLGMAALASLPLSQIVQPWLEQLSEQTGHSCSVALLDETEIVYIARAARKRVMSIGLMPGSRLPAVSTSLGRVLLAALPVGEARALVEASDLTPRTRFSVTDPEEILARIEQARAEGFAIIDQEIEIGLRSIAVPLIDGRGRVVAALNTGMAATAESAETLKDSCLPKLLKVQAGLRRVM